MKAYPKHWFEILVGKQSEEVDRYMPEEFTRITIETLRQLYHKQTALFRLEGLYPIQQDSGENSSESVIYRIFNVVKTPNFA